MAEAGFHEDSRCAFEDREGTIWIGTTTDGLLSLQARQIHSLTETDGLSYPAVTTITEGKNGVMYASTQHELHQIEDLKARLCADPESANLLPITSMLVNSSGALWVGRTGSYVRILRENSWVHFWVHPEEEMARINLIHEEKPNRVWNGHSRGLRTPEGPARTPSGLAFTNDVRSILTSQTGRVWIGTSGAGLFQMEQGRITPWPRSAPRSPMSVFDLFLDSHGMLWAGTSRGLYQVHED